ncbi:MAG: dephospho-CoA kinase [bacterium]
MKKYGKLIIGIGGNIGSGKTTVAKIFQSYGMRYISADRIGWSVLPEITNKLKKRYGNKIFSGSRIDRIKLRKIVFSNKSNLRHLNRLSHPFLLKKIYEKLKSINRGMVVIDAALLFDWPQLMNKVDYPILVTSTKVLKKKRALLRGISEKVFEQIIQHQKKESDMAKKAKYIIKNNGTLWQLKKQCQKIFKELQNDC